MGHEESRGREIVRGRQFVDDGAITFLPAFSGDHSLGLLYFLQIIDMAHQYYQAIRFTDYFCIFYRKSHFVFDVLAKINISLNKIEGKQLNNPQNYSDHFFCSSYKRVYLGILSFLLLLVMHQNQSKPVDAQDLAIIITTSPIRNNPATDVIDMAISTIEQEPTLAETTIYIICDGVKVTEQGGSKYKSGIVSELSNQQYLEFKARLKERYQANQRIVIEERVERCGFADNIRHVMSKIPHEFVLIFQHDHVLCRPCDFSAIVRAMKMHPINYIGMMNKSVRKLPYELDQHLGMRKYFCDKVNYHPTKVRHDHEEFTRAVQQYYLQLYGLPLMPLLFWYDKVHVARRSYYLETIFNPHGFLDEVSQTYVKTVSFVEDSFGCFTRKSIRHRPPKFEELSAFILWDPEKFTIMHTNGRGFLTREQKDERLQNYMKNKGTSSESQQSDKEKQQQVLNLDFMQEDQQ